MNQSAMDEDDEFLYGSSTAVETKPSSSPPPPTIVSQPTNEETSKSPNGVVAHLEAEAATALDEDQEDKDAAGGEEEEEEAAEDSDDEDDVEIIMQPISRSLDFRQNVPKTRPSSSSIPKVPPPSLTTEYTPRQRGDAISAAKSAIQDTSTPSAPVATAHQPPPTTTTPAIIPPVAQPQPQPNPSQQQQQYSTETTNAILDGIDTSKLPPVTAPPSHPAIDPTIPGVFDGRSIFETDISALAEKPWRRPGSDISDWFNYGFDEISWEAYCYRRRELGDMANVLKTNVINFAGMPEEQLTALPPEVRQMVMTGATTMMNGGGTNAAMMNPGVMMDMSMMGPMGMGMNGDMGMGNPMMQMGVDGQAGQGGVGVGGNATPEQVGPGVAMMQDGYAAGPGGPNMMAMGMGGDFAAMQEQNAMGQQMYQNMEVPGSVTPGPGARGGTPVPFRGRSMPPGAGLRGRGFASRGRGRGIYDSSAPPSVPRPASPLPPGVPTGPRNQNKYKDRDNNGPAVDGLDYGGGGGITSGKELGGSGGGRTSSGEPEDRSSSRKRRNSPGPDDRGSKRR